MENDLFMGDLFKMMTQKSMFQSVKKIQRLYPQMAINRDDDSPMDGMGYTIFKQGFATNQIFPGGPRTRGRRKICQGKQFQQFELSDLKKWYCS